MMKPWRKPGPKCGSKYRRIVATDKWRTCEHTDGVFVAAVPPRCPHCESERDGLASRALYAQMVGRTLGKRVVSRAR